MKLQRTSGEKVLKMLHHGKARGNDSQSRRTYIFLRSVNEISKEKLIFDPKSLNDNKKQSEKMSVHVVRFS